MYDDRSSGSGSREYGYSDDDVVLYDESCPAAADEWQEDTLGDDDTIRFSSYVPLDKGKRVQTPEVSVLLRLLEADTDWSTTALSFTRIP